MVFRGIHPVRWKVTLDNRNSLEGALYFNHVGRVFACSEENVLNKRVKLELT